MEARDITGQKAGKIWHRIPSPATNDGVVASVVNTGKGVKCGRLKRFLHASFDKFGEQIYVSDHLGGVYIFDTSKNRFSEIQNCGQSCTALATGLRRQNEYLVGLADSSIKCYSKDNRELVSWMRGHESAVHSISVHDSGRYGITTSRDTAQMWNFDTFERIRKLNVKSETPIQQVFFLPRSDMILTCFTDDTIFGWESDNFTWKYKLNAESQVKFGYRAFAVTRNGRILVCGGKSNLLHLYSLQNHNISQVIKLPSSVQSVKQLEFLVDKFDRGDSKILGVLGQDGIARFIDINTCHVLFDIQAPSEGDRLTKICTHSQGSDYVIGVTENGALVFYSAKSLTSEFNKAPGPLVRVVKDVWKRKALDRKNTSADSRQSHRPLDGSMTTGRIQCRKLKSESDKEENNLPNGLSLPRLLKVVRWFGEYPEAYRLFIWRSLLQLPENQSAFTSLTQKGTHLSYATIQEKYPVKSGKLLRVLERVLSSLAHWSAIFAELDYLPLMVFPFVKLFQNNALICFEMIATILTNWCQHWFEFFPNPPINVLSMIENLMSHHDRELLQHFVKYEVTTQIYAWPLLQTLMSEVLTRDEWLKLFDNVFSNHPSFFLYCVVAYSISCRSALLKTKQTDDFKYFYHHRNALDIRAVINEAYRLSECTPKKIDPKESLHPLEPIPSAVTYPIFNKYPKFIVDYQAQERERIRKDELDYLREKHIAQELTDQMTDRKLHEEAWYRKKEMLQDAEQERRRILMDEERKLIDQRKKLAAMKRELRVRELQLLDKSRMRFVDHQQTLKHIEIQRLEEELKRKTLLREQEAAAVVEDVEVKGLELEAHRATMEQEMARQQSELEDAIRVDVDRRMRLQDAEERMHTKLQEQDIDVAETKELEQQLASSQLRENALSMQTEIASRVLHGDIEREKELARSLSRNIDHLRQQKHLNDRLTQMRDIKESKVRQQQDRLRCLEMMRNDGDERRARMLEDRNLDESRRRIKESERRMEEHMNSLRREHERIQFENSLTHEGRMTAVQNAQTTDFATDEPVDDVEWSINRDRGSFAEEERHLMDDVRRLRERLVSQRRTATH
uniref:TBC1 domain family member 31 n=1 Tax=Phallusia mammillata TaxID=59560 RepID=A0A6F9DV09_9ASCI|nr:TBC1 domain family member 31 [Phallusia mammillata]